MGREGGKRRRSTLKRVSWNRGVDFVEWSSLDYLSAFNKGQEWTTAGYNYRRESSSCLNWISQFRPFFQPAFLSPQASSFKLQQARLKQVYHTVKYAHRLYSNVRLDVGPWKERDEACTFVNLLYSAPECGLLSLSISSLFLRTDHLASQLHSYTYDSNQIGYVPLSNP